MYVLERGMKQKWLGVIFAVLTTISAFGIGNMVQANSISSMVNETFHIAPWITGDRDGGAHSVCDPGWDQVDSESVRIAGTVHGHFLRRRLRHSADHECIGNSRDAYS